MFRRRNVQLSAFAALLAFVVVTALSIFTGQGVNAPKVSAEGDCQLFPETGFSVCGKFLDYWRNHGGLAQQGYPISEVFDEQNAPPPAGDGQVHKVQYFQRARFEEHLENQPPNDVLLGLLGSEQYGGKYGTQILSVRGMRTETQIFDHKPKPGNIYVVVDLLVQNITQKKMTVSPASITLRTAQVYDYKVDDATYAYSNCLKLTDINPRESVGGLLVYEIPVNDAPKSITIDYFVGKATVGL